MSEQTDRKLFSQTAHTNYIAHDDDTKHSADIKYTVPEVRELFVDIEIETEYFIVVGDRYDVKIELCEGLAEIYGTEMELHEEYKLLPHSFISVFTWHGCTIKLSGIPEATYIFAGTSMILNVVLHASLEERRRQAEALDKKGPVTLVVGPNDVSKNALCRLLLNYAVHLGHRPLFVDIDVGQNSISFPSTMGVLTIEKPADIVTGFDEHPVQMYQYGYRSSWQSIIPYFLLLQRLNATIQSYLEQTNKNIKTSGIVINGCEWSSCELRHHGYDTTKLITKAFQIDVLCVLHEEPLYLQLRRDMPPSVEVIFIPETKSFLRRDREARNKSRLARIQGYFSRPLNEMKPFSIEVKYSDIHVFKVISKSIQRFELFSGDVKETDATLMRVNISCKLVHQILALSSANDVHEDIKYMPVIGFICITNVDIGRDIITVLSPKPGPLPTKIFIMGDTRIKKCLNKPSDAKIKAKKE